MPPKFTTALDREQSLERMLGAMTDAQLDRFIETVFEDLLALHQTEQSWRKLA